MSIVRIISEFIFGSRSPNLPIIAAVVFAGSLFVFAYLYNLIRGIK